MHLAVSADSPVCDYQSRRTVASHRMKFMIAGVAVASAGALAVNPVVATPSLPAVAAVSDIRQDAVELSAFQNPLEVLAATITKTVGLTGALGGNIVATSGQLLQGLGNPALHAEFAEFIRSTLANPLLIPGELLRAPFEYGGRLITTGGDLIGAQLAALQLLPGVLQQSLTFLSQGKTLEAFGELNTWFLVDVLSDSRQTLLNALAIPGDFADAIGAHALARVFDSVLNRGTVGNLGRALLGPVVTAVIQVTEILDQTGAALMAGDLATVASNLLNAPAKIVNAFVNGYVPEFTVDPQWPPQVFPGLLSERGTFDFFFNQIPKAIAAALAPPAPAANNLAPATGEITAPSVTSTNFSTGSDGLTLAVGDLEDQSATGSGESAVVAEGVPAQPAAGIDGSVDQGSELIDEATTDELASNDFAGPTDTTAGGAAETGAVADGDSLGNTGDGPAGGEAGDGKPGTARGEKTESSAGGEAGDGKPGTARGEKSESAARGEASDGKPGNARRGESDKASAGSTSATRGATSGTPGGDSAGDSGSSGDSD